MEPLRPYKKSAEYSYTLGAFPTYELLKAKPGCAEAVYVHSTFTDREALEDLCKKQGIPILTGDKAIARVSDKENVFVVGVFHKYESELEETKSHIVLVNPGNMGNFGTILRTAVAFGIHDIACISPGADIFHPKVIRSSMGAIFRLRNQYFSSFQEYRERYDKQEVFTFMLNTEKQLMVETCPKPELFSLVFGNEATGLPEEYRAAGTSLMIPQSEEVDSLNLTIAVGIGLYLFTKGNQK